MSFHPDLRLPRFLPKAMVTPRSLRAIRLGVRLLPTRGRPRPDVVPVNAAVSVRVFRPASGGDGRALLWIHGGGMVIGAAKMDDVYCRRIARGLGITVASVDYRLAPEHPYPLPLEDCYAALQWLAAQPGTSRIAVGGASAGGGLAAGVTLAARDRGEVEVAAQLLVYPMIDDRSGVRTDVDDSVFRLWNRASNRFGWSAYLRGLDDVPAYAAPARAEDLAGLPPTWIGVGTHDLFHDEDVTYAERLRAAGVDVRLEVVPGAYHGFNAVEPGAQVTRDFDGSATRFLGEVLG